MVKFLKAIKLQIMNIDKNTSCWVITEGMAGTENQCIGIAEALGVTPVIKKIKLRMPWRKLTPYLGLEMRWSFSPALEEPWPDIIIASGRKSIAASNYIKKMSKGKTFRIQVQDPRISPANFNFVVLPEHDPTRGMNVFVTKAAPNRITPEKLEQARAQFPSFENIKQPRVAVMIGGNSKAYKLTSGRMQNLANQLKTLDAGLMISTSRRTGIENEKILRDTLEESDAYIWDGKGDNPYLGMLAWADYILVSADSVSMISEACTTGKPAFMLNLEGGRPRLKSFHQNLVEYGALRVFKGRLERWQYTPLNDAMHSAEEIHKRYKAFQQQAGLKERDAL